MVLYTLAVEIGKLALYPINNTDKNIVSIGVILQRERRV